ncbi:MAG: hypothetical protein PHC61_18630, partial [Chitinivibrionales bacterium]|nr:hypothetical protein [Chitinivibrionales bacterium]
MQIIRDESSLPSLTKSVVTIGNFDGVHAGHAMLIKEVVSRARQGRLVSVVATFEPHTRTILKPDAPFLLLSSFEEKARLIEALGVDFLVCLPFSARYSQMSADRFVAEILIGRFHAVELVLGEGHAFGKNRAGDKNFLHTAVGKNHFSVFVANLFAAGSTVISSSLIREALISGRMND